MWGQGRFVKHNVRDEVARLLGIGDDVEDDDDFPSSRSGGDAMTHAIVGHVVEELFAERLADLQRFPGDDNNDSDSDSDNDDDSSVQLNITATSSGSIARSLRGPPAVKPAGVVDHSSSSSGEDTNSDSDRNDSTSSSSAELNPDEPVVYPSRDEMRAAVRKVNFPSNSASGVTPSTSVEPPELGLLAASNVKATLRSAFDYAAAKVQSGHLTEVAAIGLGFQCLRALDAVVEQSLRTSITTTRGVQVEYVALL